MEGTVTISVEDYQSLVDGERIAKNRLEDFKQLQEKFHKWLDEYLKSQGKELVFIYPEKTEMKWDVKDIE